MPTSALAIVTRGMIYPPEEINVEVCDKPIVSAVVEVRPTIRATTPPAAEGIAEAPKVVSSREIAPQIQSSQGPQIEAGQDDPTVVAAEELKPQITKAEEE